MQDFFNDYFFSPPYIFVSSVNFNLKHCNIYKGLAFSSHLRIINSSCSFLINSSNMFLQKTRISEICLYTNYPISLNPCPFQLFILPTPVFHSCQVSERTSREQLDVSCTDPKAQSSFQYVLYVFQNYSKTQIKSIPYYSIYIQYRNPRFQRARDIIF